MESDTKHKRAVVVGALIGAVIGAGTAHLFINNPDTLDDQDMPPLKGSDLLSLTAAASILVRKISDIRRRL